MVGLLWTNDRPFTESLFDNTQHLNETDIHALGRIRTRNPSKHAAADTRLKPPGSAYPLLAIFKSLRPSTALVTGST